MTGCSCGRQMVGWLCSICILDHIRLLCFAINHECVVYSNFLRSNSPLDRVLNRIVSIIWRKQVETEVIYWPYNVRSNCMSGSLEALVRKLARYSTDTPRLTQFHIYVVFQQLKDYEIMFFETVVELFLACMRAQWDEIGGRILMGDNTGGVGVLLWWIRFHRFGVWISFGLPCIYIYI